MIFTWRGRGYVALLSVLAYGLLGGAINGFLKVVLHVPFPIQPILGGIIGLIVFYYLWIYGKKWNAQTRTLIDKDTGQEIVFKNIHTAFWIPMQYWAIIWPVILVLILITNRSSLFQ
jgi:ribose/xylose/arabinose/galactoside ABC-type transport system permease subunit